MKLAKISQNKHLANQHELGQQRRLFPWKKWMIGVGVGITCGCVIWVVIRNQLIGISRDPLDCDHLPSEAASRQQIWKLFNQCSRAKQLLQKLSFEPVIAFHNSLENKDLSIITKIAPYAPNEDVKIIEINQCLAVVDQVRHFLEQVILLGFFVDRSWERSRSEYLRANFVQQYHGAMLYNKIASDCVQNHHWPDQMKKPPNYNTRYLNSLSLETAWEDYLTDLHPKIIDHRNYVYSVWEREIKPRFCQHHDSHPDCVILKSYKPTE